MIYDKGKIFPKHHDFDGFDQTPQFAEKKYFVHENFNVFKGVSTRSSGRHLASELLYQ